MKPIVLIGMMASGKTTIGKKLAKDLHVTWTDVDRAIEKQENMRISQLFNTKGERYFRQREHAMLSQCLQTHQVISGGGGIIVSESNRHLLAQHATVIYLKASIPTLLRRVDITNRPLLQNEDIEVKLTQLLKQRQDYYLNTADIIIETDKKSVKQIVELIKLKLN
ncbi:MAG: shikimate kinase [Turicibacter sp.]